MCGKPLPEKLDSCEGYQAEDWDAQMPEGALQGQIHGVDIHEAVQGQAAAGDGSKGKADCTEQPVYGLGERDADAAKKSHVLHPKRNALHVATS